MLAGNRCLSDAEGVLSKKGNRGDARSWEEEAGEAGEAGRRSWRAKLRCMLIGFKIT
jgi:hypothetical protein